MTTGERIARRRREIKLTQERLAERTELKVRDIVLIEHGRKIATIDELMRISHALEVDIHVLIEPGVQHLKAPKKSKKKKA